MSSSVAAGTSRWAHAVGERNAGHGRKLGSCLTRVRICPIRVITKMRAKIMMGTGSCFAQHRAGDCCLRAGKKFK